MKNVQDLWLTVGAKTLYADNVNCIVMSPALVPDDNEFYFICGNSIRNCT